VSTGKEGANNLRKNGINVLEMQMTLVRLLAAAKCSRGRNRLTNDWS
jgi:hypothetical protein